MQTTQKSNRIKTSELLRTKGAVTGNFGKAKVKAGSTLSDLGTSDRESVGNLPTQDEYVQRLKFALQKTTDERLKAFIRSEIAKANNRKIDMTTVSQIQRTLLRSSKRQRFAGR